ncbi:D-alanyl-D-alanine carboxypeptidase/D-alanyl-D-alanine-endopeptidase [Rothia sp. ZJ932]|uniref:D-alanyl-D-alanine carboxypeptidase/D-alanyl-D-alanine endopeptidase n=1 Tax=Rothia sp. ZJ932 TaxID=2810516 RepID=UPI0019682EA0|nr:D-alanyl-D-alanine carboxypeptidase/D-alanyl-D-alanine-endopeptidase [Rothia sp. ZJ932]QRZ61747.1 D-alanyl-D-alanine carboxypeptidase/D-alanyl-D-alanine-endopeptidase [Rothia sp. ZJ932]
MVSQKAIGSLAGVATLACVGAGVWAVPQMVAANNLEEQAQPRYATHSPISPQPPQVSSTTNAQVLAQALDDIFKDFKGTVSARVEDPATGEVLYSRNDAEPRTPASNLKFLIDYTVLRTFSLTDTFTTSTVLEGETITLVAGGDTLLSTGVSDPQSIVGRAGLQTLAQDTIDALTAQGGSGTYEVNLDTSAFSGPSANPKWSQEDTASGFVSDVHPIALYSHSIPVNGAPTENRYDNAADSAHRAFIDALNALAPQDTSFTTGDNTPASPDAQQLSTVESAPVYEQSAYMMQVSDNLLAETLGRASALKSGKEGSIDGAISHVEEVLTHDGFTTQGLTLKDLCGLLPTNKVTNQLITEIITSMMQNEHGTAHGLDSLPIAGGTGTLTSRFDDPDESGAQGYVRAKTGTLNDVLSLSGYTVTPGEQVLVFSIITNDVDNTSQAKNTLDRAAALIAGRR